MTSTDGRRVEIPQLETERLRLRGHRPDDFDHCVALWSDPRVVQFISTRPLTREEVWARALRYVGHWLWMNYGPWVVEEKRTGHFVGEVGYSLHKRDIQPPLGDRPELGWALLPAFQGKGCATEAVRAAMVWGAQKFAKRETVCIIAPENLKSIRVAEKCGFREWRRTTYKGDPTIVYVHAGQAGSTEMQP